MSWQHKCVRIIFFSLTQSSSSTNDGPTDIFSQTTTISSWKLKGLVYLCFLIQTAQVILGSHDEFWQLGFSYGDMEGLTAVYTSWITIPWLTGISMSIILLSPIYQREPNLQETKQQVPLCNASTRTTFFLWAEASFGQS